VTFANPLPWWALLGLIIATGGVAWLAYGRSPFSVRKRALLLALRFITLLLLIVLLMRPVIQSGPNGPADAVVPILVDTSRSMSIEDAGGVRRIDRARQVVEQLLPAVRQRFQTEVLGFGEALTPAAPHQFSASARRTDFAGALQAVRDRYHGRTIAGIVLISDGGDTSSLIERGLAETGPAVFPIGIGPSAVVRDREVLSATAAEAVLDDSRVDLAVSAVSHGFATAPIELRLLENGRPIEVRRSTPTADGSPVREVFQVAPAKGTASVYSVEIPKAADELVPENNSRSVLVQPPPRARRILLVQGAPGFEHSFLRRAWNGDTGLEIDSIVRKGKNEQGSDTFYIQAAPNRSPTLASGYPAARENLFAYDVVVLANVDASLLTRAQLDATKDFVGRRGGGLLVLGAHSFLRRGLVDTALEELLPLDLAERGRGVVQAAAGNAPLGANRVSLTPAGEAHPIMQLTGGTGETRKRWENVPALASIAPLGAARPGATVLAVSSGPGGTARPLVAVQRYGDGRSMIFAGEAAWRWRMLLPATDRSYDTFWRQAARWLAFAATDPVAISGPSGVAAGETIALRVTARNPGFDPLPGATVDVKIARPDGKTDSVAAAADTSGSSDGVFVARYRADDAGVYRATAVVRVPDAQPVSAATTFLVGGADAEMADPRLNLHTLQRLASASGGRMIDAAHPALVTDELHAALPAAAVLARHDLWHNAWSFAAIVALLAAEWILRRRWGLR
jgi:uncharacterized membrane protein